MQRLRGAGGRRLAVGHDEAADTEGERNGDVERFAGRGGNREQAAGGTGVEFAKRHHAGGLDEIDVRLHRQRDRHIGGSEFEDAILALDAPHGRGHGGRGDELVDLDEDPRVGRVGRRHVDAKANVAGESGLQWHPQFAERQSAGGRRAGGRCGRRRACPRFDRGDAGDVEGEVGERLSPGEVDVEPEHLPAADRFEHGCRRHAAVADGVAIRIGVEDGIELGGDGRHVRDAGDGGAEWGGDGGAEGVADGHERGERLAGGHHLGREQAG